MESPRAHLTLSKREGRCGLLLWAQSAKGKRKQARPSEVEALPPELRSVFARGAWLKDVALLGPSKKSRKKNPDTLGELTVSGWWLEASAAATALAALSMTQLRELTPSVGVWALASKWVVEAVFRELVVPALKPTTSNGNGAARAHVEVWDARWQLAPVRPDDRTRLADLAAALPGVARSWPEENGTVLTAASALDTYMNCAADGLMRAPTAKTAPRPAEGTKWVMRLGAALAGPDASFTLETLADRTLPRAMSTWIDPVLALSSPDRALIGFRLEEPKSDSMPWRVSFHLVDGVGETRVPVADLLAGKREAIGKSSAWTRPEETLLGALARCVPVFEPFERALGAKLTPGVSVDASEAWDFLTHAGLQLERAGYFVEVPRALSAVGTRRVRGRMRVGVRPDIPTAPSERERGLLAGLVHFRWEVSLGDDTLTAREFTKLVETNAPLVLHRGKWVAVDPADIERLRALMQKGGGTLEAAEALRLALAGEVQVDELEGITAEVVTDGPVERALKALLEGPEAMRTALDDELEPPDGLCATLRPYQERGYAWLESVTSTGLGACLADDMGLGKTVQLLALLQYVAESRIKRRFLVVCPTSVIGNWAREIWRFTPELNCVIHHGPSRAGSLKQLKERMDGEYPNEGAVVITSYALVRGDQRLLSRFTFDAVVLDEAQNIKNPEAGQSQAVRKLSARRTIALTGTPVENRLTELWSIMDFLNPGLLGNRSQFKKTFAIPVERYGDNEAAEQLRRITSPFILRRLKTDPTIAPELPEKDEIVRYCPLTREQASLYQKTIDMGMEEIQGMEQGMKRRGRILAMLTQLKQICNHPAHYLKDKTNKPSRSGKALRFMDLMENVLDNDGAALIFTQYREMGDLLAEMLTKAFVPRAPFLHGGLSRTAREKMVKEFQHPSGPPVMIVSLRAGGTGLNLTRANHVFHYDRWWNPAVEDQATDRAFRIGQTRDVTVHRMVCQGTLEEQIHQMLEEKRQLADAVIEAGERWLSELDDDDLTELITLGRAATLEGEGL